MPGLQNASNNKLASAFMAVSLAMVLLGTALTPSDGASVTANLVWIGGAVALVGAWVVLGVELVRRFFGGGDRSEQEG